MKKSIFTLLVLFVTLSMAAQKGGPEKPAKKVADEMTEVLKLNEEESQKIYDLQLERYQGIFAVKKQYANDEETMKAEIKKVNKGKQKELMAVLGKEKMDIWRAHLKKRNNK